MKHWITIKDTLRIYNGQKIETKYPNRGKHNPFMPQIYYYLQKSIQKKYVWETK